MPSLFGVDLPQTNKFALKNTLRALKPGSKKTLYFLYSEFMLRANRNPWYKHVLSRSNLSAIDGKGLQWSMWTLMGEALLPRIYKTVIGWPDLLRVPIFVVMFPLQLFINIFVGAVTLLLKFNYTNRTKNEVILGREFVYDLLKIGEENGWKTLVLGGSAESDTITKELIQKLFPKINLITWNREYNSLLMTDTPTEAEYGAILTSENILQAFPDLFEAKEYIKREKPELILTCLGGGSGKQEFFIDNIARDKEITFTLATGLGAAVDHLGGGQQQPLAPNWMIVSGLEWLYRLIRLPKRRGRIMDSILTLWWWTTVEQFMRCGGVRDTVVSVVYKEDVRANSYLLVDRPRVLPGDRGYSFVQGGIKHKEGIAKAGLRELCEETSIKPEHIKQRLTPFRGALESHTVSLLRFLIQGARYRASQHYVALFEYTGPSKITTNWENRSCSWVSKSQVEEHLSIEKRKDWQLAQTVIEKNY